MFRNVRRVHYFILCLNYMLFPFPLLFRQCIAIFAVAEGWLFLDIGLFVLFFFINEISDIHLRYLGGDRWVKVERLIEYCQC